MPDVIHVHKFHYNVGGPYHLDSIELRTSGGIPVCCEKRFSATIQRQDNRLGFSQVFVRVITRCAETSADLKCTECQRPLELPRFGQPLQVQNVSQERVILNISVNLTVYGAGPDHSVGDPNAE